jgi:hypothetical protein
MWKVGERWRGKVESRGNQRSMSAGLIFREHKCWMLDVPEKEK